MVRSPAMLRTAFVVLLLGYLPGALLFRVPALDRERRAALTAEERLFWAVVLSAALSSAGALSLAFAGTYALERVLWLNGAVCLGIGLGWRARLRLGAPAPQPTRSAAAPLALAAVAAGLFFFVPPAEYINGGRDPGVYFNAGIQIARHGAVVIDDPLVRTIPAEHRDLFFLRPSPSPGHESIRFLGFFVTNQDAGTVVGQFPPLYPVWIAIAYDTLGLTGARHVHGLWAVLGVLAVYFAGAFVLGRRAAFAGTALLAVHVAQVWFARYFCAEMILQPLVFAGVLACARAHADGGRFFAPVAGVLLGLAPFVHLTGIVALAAAGAAGLASRAAGYAVRPSFVLPLAALSTAAVACYALVLTPYTLTTLEPFLRRLSAPAVIGGGSALLAAAAGLWLAGGRATFSRRMRRWLPVSAAAALPVLAAYALAVREPARRALELDPVGLTPFTAFYLTPLGLAAALAGWSLAAGRRWWRGWALLAVAGVFAVVFFTYPRIAPDHFWAARRYVSIILPAALLLAGAAVFMPVTWPRRFPARTADGVRTVLGAAALTLLGWQFTQATLPVLRHTEYAGMIADVESLAARFAPDDLLVFPTAGASDAELLALPLAYIHGRNVAVLTDDAPDPAALARFLDWARARYARTFFIGAGVRLLSPRTGAEPVADVRAALPFYDRANHAYPQGVDQWNFDYGIYELVARTGERAAFALDVGVHDHLHVAGMHGRSIDERGVTYRWTTGRSVVQIVDMLPGAQTLTLRMSDGGRPAEAAEARVTVFLDDQPLGAIVLDDDDAFRTYTLPIPAALAGRAVATLRLDTASWVPLDLLGISDRRELGVMLARVEIH